jgi:hypothetical protein
MPCVFLLLACACTLVRLGRLDWRAWNGLAKAEPLRAQTVMARYEPLRRFLPEKEIVDFCVETTGNNKDAPASDARFYLAQYALSPRRLVLIPARDKRTTRFLIIDSDQADDPSLASASLGTLIADLRNGVRLYENKTE